MITSNNVSHKYRTKFYISYKKKIPQYEIQKLKSTELGTI